MKLRAENISFRYPGSEELVLAGADLMIHPGEMLAVIGGNGSGKTTLGLILAGAIQPESGDMYINEKRIEDPGELRRRAGYLFQDPEDGFLATSVEREIAFGPENFGVDTPEIRRRVDELARDFDLAKIKRDSVAELSGGQMVRCALAASMAVRPRLLILDEPDSFLDFEGKRLFWRKVCELRRQGISIVHITQSTAAANHADRIFEMKSGKLFPINKIDRIQLPPREGLTPGKTAVSARDLDFSYGNKLAISDVDIELKRREGLAVLGPSGANSGRFICP